MKKGSVLFCAGIVAFGIGCGDDSLSEDDSQTGFFAANAVLMQGGAQAQASGLVAVDYDFNCLEGGAANFKGTFDNTDNGGTFNYSVTFDNCISQGVTLSGNMTYFLSVTGTENSTSIVYNYNGNIGFAGEVDGDCPLNMTAKVASTTGATGGNVSYEYSGVLCGNEAGFMNAGSFNFNIPN